MKGWLAVLLGIGLAAPMVAAAAHQPPTDAGEMPVSFVYAKTAPDANVRTSVVVTDGPGPGAQRLVYGTADGAVHLQTLDRGSPVGPSTPNPELGVDVDEGPVNDSATFGQGSGTISPVDTSTEERLGHLLVLHNDNGAVHLAMIDAATGTSGGPAQAIDESLGCTANSTPVVTPPDPVGDRYVFFTLSGSACRQAGLLRARVPRSFAEAPPSWEVELAPVGDVNPVASPALVYLEDAGGTIRALVAVAAGNRLALYSAVGDFAGRPPVMTGQLPAGETPQTPLAAVTASGLPAGAPGSGATESPAVFVAAATPGGGTRVHKFVQRGVEQALALVGSTAELGGAPAPQMATGEVAEGTDTRPGGRLVVTTSAAAHVLEAENLALVGSLAASPGFSRTAAVVSGDFAYLQRDNGEPIVARTADVQRVPRAEFSPHPSHVAGNAFGAPSVSRGYVAWGGAPGAFVYRNRDVTAPFVTLSTPDEDSVLAGDVTFSAVAGDWRGLKQVDFRLIGPSGNPRVVARDVTADEGSPFLAAGARYSGSFQAASLPNGVYVADAVVTDTSGNTMVSGRRTVRIAGSGKGMRRRGGRCSNVLRGAFVGDQLTGTAAGDRILGLDGDDVLRGLGGADCLSGHDGDDRLSGGAGKDRLRGGTGDDRLAGGPGRDRLDGGAGVNRLTGGGGNDYVNALNGRRDLVSCGRGRDRARADRNDRLRGCESVRRPRRPARS